MPSWLLSGSAWRSRARAWMMGGVNKALAIVMTAAAVLLAGCGGAGGTGGTGSGGDGGAAPAAPPRTSTASADVDWQQINDFYAAEFRLSCTEVGGSAQGKCI